MCRSVFSLFLTLYTFFIVHGHQEQLSDSSRFQRYLDSAYNQDKPNQALFDSARSLIRNDYQYLKFNNEFSLYHRYKLNNPDSAFSLLQENFKFEFDIGKGEDYLKELARSYRYWGRFATGVRDYERIIENIPQAIALFENFEPVQLHLSYFYTYMGYAYYETQEYDKAEVWFRQVISHASKMKFRERERHAYYLLGQIYANQNKNQQAKEHFRYSLYLLNKYDPLDWQDFIQANNSLGNLFIYEQEYDSAVNRFKSIEKYINEAPLTDMTDGSKDYFMAVVYNNIGNVLWQKQDYEAALEYTHKSLIINESIFGKNSHQLIRNLKQLGKIYQLKQAYGQALLHLTRSLIISKRHQFDLIFSYNRIGDLYMAMGDLENSEHYFDSALVVCDIKLTAYKDPKLNFKARDALAALIGQIQVEAKKDVNDLDEITLLYQQYKHVAGILFEETESKAIFDRIPIGLEGLYGIYAREYEKNLDPEYLQILWEITEINKSKKLNGHLKRQYTLKHFLTKALLDEHKKLKDRLNLLAGKIEPNRFDSSFFKAKKKYQDFMSQLSLDHPRYYELLSANENFQLSIFRSELEDEEVILNFMEGSDHVFLIKLSRSDHKLISVSKPEFQTALKAHNKSVSNKDQSQILASSNTLLELLPIMDESIGENTKFSIIPDGIVWKLNFNALAFPKDNAISYLGNHHELTYRYTSAEGLKSAKTQGKEVFAFAYNDEKDVSSISSSSNRNSPGSLPGSSLELRSISNLLDGDYFYGKSANETTFKLKGGQYDILHLALHAFENDRNPNYSYLKFSAADSLNDGELHAFEIYNLQLNAKLAVLSACNSGQGKIVGGEGMMSLGRAFSYAGAESVLISRWEVADYSAPYLMKAFYEGLKKGMRKSQSLKYAQAKYLKEHSDDLTASPFYWSPFYILGDDSPIFKSSAISPWMLLWVVCVLLSTLLFLRRKRTTTHS